MGKKVSDTHIWQAATQDVVKLGHAKPNRPKTPKMPSPTNPSEGFELRPKAITPVLRRHTKAPIPILSASAQRLAGCCPSVPSKTFKLLGQGLLTPQGVIDLHGLREGDAWLELHAFLDEAQGAEVQGREAVRVVLVIHGKGTGHGALRDMGVLKSQMAAQLAQHPAVLAFHTAQPQHGGQGATYVLVRQR
jgi:DNA-nicking Smr family endonuclease